MRGTFCDPETGEVFENAELRTQEQRESYKKYLDTKKEYEFKGAEIKEKYKKYDECLYINDKFFKRGKIELNEDENKIRLYQKNIRCLYEKSKPCEHKFLSYLFQAIPFINKNYNIISHNPFEDDLDLVQPMQMTEYCRLINYD